MEQSNIIYILFVLAIIFIYTANYILDGEEEDNGTCNEFIMDMTNGYVPKTIYYKSVGISVKYFSNFFFRSKYKGRLGMETALLDLAMKQCDLELFNIVSQFVADPDSKIPLDSLYYQIHKLHDFKYMDPLLTGTEKPWYSGIEPLQLTSFNL